MDGSKDTNEKETQNHQPESPLEKFVGVVGGIKSILVIWGPLDEEFFAEVLPFAKKNKYADKNRIEKLNIILHSDGGDPHLTYKVARVLRTYFKEITVYVPYSAKSGATLLCLVADEIVLSPGSDLGPLDTQIIDPNDPRKYISALEVTESLKEAAEFLYTEIRVMLRQLREAKLTRSELLSIVTQLTEVMGQLLFKQVELAMFTACKRALETITRYGVKLLMQRGIKERKAVNIILDLVEGYPCHLFAIDIDEAGKIDLPARETNVDEYRGLDELCNEISDMLKKRNEKRYYGPLMIL